MKRFSTILAMTTLALMLAFVSVNPASAQLADGEYEVPYEMKEANSENTSIADGYFQKPAKVKVKGDQATVEFTVTSADMVQSMKVSGSSLKTVGEGNDTRTYRFDTSLSKLEKPVTMDMHIIVPDLPELPGGYDREHQARAVFDLSSAKKVGGTSEKTDEDKNEQATSGEGAAKSDKDKDADNPKTGDDSPIVMYTVLLIGAAGAFILVRKFLPVNN